MNFERFFPNYVLYAKEFRPCLAIRAKGEAIYTQLQSNIAPIPMFPNKV